MYSQYYRHSGCGGSLRTLAHVSRRKVFPSNGRRFRWLVSTSKSVVKGTIPQEGFGISIEQYAEVRTRQVTKDARIILLDCI